MRLKFLIFAAFAPVLLAAPAKEIVDLQRQVADLGDQISTTQKSLAALTQLVQQVLEVEGKTNTGVSSINSGVTQTMQRELQSLKDSVAPIPSMSSEVKNTKEEITNLTGEVSDQNAKLNKMATQINDVLMQVKLLQAPAAAPPPVGGDSAALPGAVSGALPGAASILPPGTAGPPPLGSTLFSAAQRDENGGKPDLALDEFAQFLKLYPNDPNAIQAQFEVGNIHYSLGQLDQAVKDFDNVIEGYSEDKKLTPDAYFNKGMALKQGKHVSEAATVFRALREKYPGSPQAAQAATQLRAMAQPLTPPATHPGAKRSAPK